MITVDGERQHVPARPGSFVRLRRTWQQERVHVELPRKLTACPLPDAPDTVAFMDGPEVLAGLCDHEVTLYGDRARPETMLTPDNEREWTVWYRGYRTVNQPRGVRFIPLRQVRDERYTVYFPVQPRRERV